ncbi:MAG: ATP-binding protein [Pseudomonas sp.]|nr:ATP-binding protein [Pseudomonas sp.]
MFIKTRLNITHKILLLVGTLSGLAALITLYSLNNLNMVDKNYRYLLDHKTSNTLVIADALLDLSDASRLAFSVLTEQEEQQMRVTQALLTERQQVFVAKLEKISDLTAQQKLSLSAITVKQAQVFNVINDVIEAAARWRGDRALVIIHTQLEPSLTELRRNMDQLQTSIINDYLSTSQSLADTTKNTILNTAVAVGLTLVSAIGFASFLAFAGISRPITRLTSVMSRLSDHHYDDEPIEYRKRDDEVGRMAQALHVFRDNMQRADRLELEAANSAENKRLSEQLIALTDAMPGAVFQLLLHENDSKQFLFLNSKIASFLGQTPDMLLNRTFAHHETIFPGSTTFQWVIKKAFNRSRQSLQPIDTDIRIKRNGQVFWYKILATCKPTEHLGTLFNGILLDVTAMKQQAQALEEAKNSAEHAARAKERFLTTMSHEIRTPMNAILGLTRLTLRHSLSDDQQQRVEKIKKAGCHLLSIINDILDFSKINSNQLQLEHIRFTPAALVSETVAMLADEAEKKGLRFYTEIDPQLPDDLQGDPTRIAQILLNYLNNAIKFSESGAIHIRLRLQCDNPSELKLYGEIEDQGIGISPAHLSHLFKEFQQADASITRRFGGTGLGLAISKKLAQLMHGDVGAYSEEGKGSTFWFTAAVTTIQHDASPNKTIEKAPVLLLPVHFKGLVILLVDDNELNRLVGKELLEEAGFTVELADNGQQAVERIQAHDSHYYSAVLMDIMMPIMDGISATKKIRTLTQGQQLPIIAVSANTLSEDTQRYMAAGMNAYISKPIDEKTLWDTLSQHIVQSQYAYQNVTDPVTPSALQLNQQHLQSLRDSMPRERFLNLLLMLIEDYEKRLACINSMDNTLDNNVIQQNLHDLISTAGHAGFNQLSKLALDMNNALHTDDQQHISDLHQRIIAELHSALTYLQQQAKQLQSQAD